MDDYRPAPFWFLNHRLERGELARQIALMKDAGCSGFFIHPRAGLQTPYGGEEWFSLVAFIIEEAGRLGLKAWLYDEDPFPSGIAGGKVVFDHPEFAARSLAVRRFRPDADGWVRADLGTGTILSAVAVRGGPNGDAAEVADLRESIGVLREHYLRTEWNSAYYAGMLGVIPYPHYRAETFYPHQVLHCPLEGVWEVFVAGTEASRDGDKYGCRPDNMNPAAVALFLAHTHERYRRQSGAHFGRTVPGIFTDEPAPGSLLPWTGALPQAFAAEKGYALESNLHHLAADFGEDSRRVREDYWEVVNHLYRESYFGQIHRWCRRHGLRTTGHIICEENPIYQVLTGGNIAAYQRYCDIPGFDVVTTHVGSARFPALSFGGKLIASTAHQQGKKRVLSECLGCAPWNFGPDGMRRQAHWLFALGITWLVPHGFFYSIDGFRKDDAGKAFSFQDPHYADFPAFAAYAARLGSVLAEADHCARTAVLYQMSAFWQELPANLPAAEALRDRLYAVNQRLLSAQVEFDWVDEETLLAGRAGGGAVACGRETYTSIILPFPERSGRKVEACLAKLREAGVAVIAADAEGNFVEEAKAAGAVWTAIAPADSDSRTEDLMALRKRRGKREILYLYNNSARPGRFRLARPPARHAYVYDAEAGTTAGLRPGEEGLSIVLDGYQARLFLFSDRRLPNGGDYTMPAQGRAVEFAFDTQPQWDYQPPGEVLAAISRWNLRIEGQGGRREVTDQRYCLLRDVLGTELAYLREHVCRPQFDRAPIAPSLYPVRATFQAAFGIQDAARPARLVFESETLSGRADLRLNGRPLDLAGARRERVYDPCNLVLDVTGLLRPGPNVLEIEFAEAGESDGLKSLLYIMPAAS